MNPNDQDSKNYLFLTLLFLFLFSAQVGTRAEQKFWGEDDYTDFEDEFNDYDGWTDPESISIKLLKVVAKYVDDNGLEYVHHDDKRYCLAGDFAEPIFPGFADQLDDLARELVKDGVLEMDGFSLIIKSQKLSQHCIGEAMDFRFRVPERENPILFFKKHLLGLEMAFIEAGLIEFALGFYLDTTNLFYHVDTGLNKPLFRRWARINGKYVSFGEGLDELNRRIKQGIPLRPEFW